MLRYDMTAKVLCISCFLAMLFAPIICKGDADTIYKENSGAVVVVIAIDGKGTPLAREAALSFAKRRRGD